VTIGPRSEDTILTVHENANEGWLATMNGRRLPSIVVDGWQQGYVVPAGLSSATVHLDFAPDAAMTWGLGAGFFGVILLVGGALLGGAASPTVTSRRSRPWAIVAGGAVTLALIGGWAGVLVAAISAGMWALTRARRRPRAEVLTGLPALAGIVYLVAVARLASAPWGSAGYAAGSRLAQWCCLAAIGIACAVTQPDQRTLEDAEAHGSQGGGPGDGQGKHLHDLA
jgi:arabinofuranan 3-O-arabinosyltransferase